MDKKILYIDCETTGTDPIKNDIIQISLIIEVNNVIKEKHNIFMQPYRYDNINPTALEIQNRTVQEIKAYPTPDDGYKKIISVFNSYIDRYDKKDKFDYVGYNVHFDINFLFQFFKRNNNPYLFSYIGNKIDVYGLLQFLVATNKINDMNHLPNLRLQTVCDAFGVHIEAHDSMSDVEATRELFKKIDKKITIKGDSYND